MLSLPTTSMLMGVARAGRLFLTLSVPSSSFKNIVSMLAYKTQGLAQKKVSARRNVYFSEYQKRAFCLLFSVPCRRNKLFGGFPSPPRVQQVSMRSFELHGERNELSRSVVKAYTFKRTPVV